MHCPLVLPGHRSILGLSHSSISSLQSPQWSIPSQRWILSRHRLLFGHLYWEMEQASDDVPFPSSSPVLQFSVPSLTQEFGMQRPLTHWNSFGRQNLRAECSSVLSLQSAKLSKTRCLKIQRHSSHLNSSLLQFISVYVSSLLLLLSFEEIQSLNPLFTHSRGIQRGFSPFFTRQACSYPRHFKTDISSLLSFISFELQLFCPFWTNHLGIHLELLWHWNSSSEKL